MGNEDENQKVKVIVLCCHGENPGHSITFKSFLLLFNHFLQDCLVLLPLHYLRGCNAPSQGKVLYKPANCFFCSNAPLKQILVAFKSIGCVKGKVGRTKDRFTN